MAKAKRKSLSKKVRFEVFKRDSFQCQYCGSKAPEAILHVDHINPVSKGGDNEIINLVTSCEDCNQGKSDRLLTDSTSIEVQRAQLEDLNQRREQLTMMLEWRDSLKGLDDETVDKLIERIEEHIPGHSINETGRKSVFKWVKKFSVTEILDAADIASSRMAGDIDSESVARFFDLIPKICATKRLPETEQRLRYARGILRNRVYVNEAIVMELMRDAVDAGVDVEQLIAFTKEVRNWTQFREEMEALTHGES